MQMLPLQDGEDSMAAMKAALRFVLIWGGILALILIPVWPLLALAAGTFSEGNNPKHTLPVCMPYLELSSSSSPV